MGRFDFYDPTEIVKSFYLTAVGAAPAAEGTFQLYPVLLTAHCFPSIILCRISWFHSTIQYISKQMLTSANSSPQPTHSLPALAQGQGIDYKGIFKYLVFSRNTTMLAGFL